MSFSDIPSITPKPPSSDPFEIFARRPSLAGTPNDLWGGQRDALQEWVKIRKKHDVLISLNTGSGKTMLGVLIAQSMSNEKAGKCVYVCSTIDLVLQTEREANKLGISPTTYHGSEFSDSNFEQGKTFCITTYPSVFNANTTFRKHNVNKFIFDDAHVAEKAIRDAFTLNISKATYPDLFERIARLASPSFAAAGQSFKFKEVMDQNDNAIVLVPPMLALGISDEISDEIRKALRGHPDLFFPYMYICDKMKVCGITVSGWSIEISPPFLPTAVTFPFSQENMRRVYLSATLQTQAEFARAFGKNPDATIEPETDAGNGERCILFGHSVPDEDTGPKLVSAIKAEHKLVITCRSYTDAKPWETLAVIPKRETFSADLETFKNATKGAFVLVARVDGIDLPDDVCRVMLIDNLPSGYSQLERFQIEYCAMTALAATKLASRITQVFGRINRGRKDYGVFILRGRTLNNWLSDAENAALLPELLQKQLLLGEQVSSRMLRNKNYAAVIEVMDSVMARDPDWISTYGSRIADAELPPEAKASAREKDILLTEAALSESKAMFAAWKGDFEGAAAALAETADKAAIADARLAGWHNLWLGWFYELAGDSGAAEAEYARARSRLGSAVYLPKPEAAKIAAGQKLPLRGSRLFNLVSEEHVSRFDREVSLIGKRFEPLAVDDASAARHEEATRALGEALGFNSSRPDNMYRTGPDVLWIDGEEKCCLLFELKTHQNGDKPITKKAVGQGHDHIQWVKNNHPGITIVGLIFIADTRECNGDANPSSGMYIGPLDEVCKIGHDLIAEIKSIRSSLPFERLIKVSGYVAEAENGLPGILNRISAVKLNTEPGD
jgi:hypothetical protein